MVWLDRASEMEDGTAESQESDSDRSVVFTSPPPPRPSIVFSFTRDELRQELRACTQETLQAQGNLRPLTRDGLRQELQALKRDALQETLRGEPPAQRAEEPRGLHPGAAALTREELQQELRIFARETLQVTLHSELMELRADLMRMLPATPMTDTSLTMTPMTSLERRVSLDRRRPSTFSERGEGATTTAPTRSSRRKPSALILEEKADENSASALKAEEPGEGRHGDDKVRNAHAGQGVEALCEFRRAEHAAQTPPESRKVDMEPSTPFGEPQPLLVRKSDTMNTANTLESLQQIPSGILPGGVDHSHAKVHWAKLSPTSQQHLFMSPESPSNMYLQSSPTHSQGGHGGRLSRRGSISSRGSLTRNHTIHFGFRAPSLDFEGSETLESPMLDKIRGYILSPRLAAVVSHYLFDYLSALLIIANCVMIGQEADLAARHGAQAVPAGYFIANVAFCAVFALELLLRTQVWLSGMSRMTDGRWNLLDTILVAHQIVELVLHRTVGSGGPETGVAAIRVLRVLRLARISRTLRILRVAGELRTIVLSIATCLMSLAWTLVLLFLVIYVLAVIFTQVVSDHIEDKAWSGQEPNPALRQYYGNLASAIYSLYQAVSGGMDWEAVANPLVEEVSPACGFVFCLYIAFVVNALLNVVAGVFVQSAINGAEEEKKADMLDSLRQLLETMDTDQCGRISWENFKSHLDNPQMRDLFHAIDIELQEQDARGLFMLLDQKGEGAIGIEDFMGGVIKLRGQPRSLDQALLLHELRRLFKRSLTQGKLFERQLERVESELRQATELRQVAQQRAWRA